MPEVEIDILRRRAEDMLRDAGVTAEQARILVDHMLTADLWGRGSHGLSVRFGATYRKAREGAGDRSCEVVADRGHYVTVDAHNGFGYVAGTQSAEILIERVDDHGMAGVALRNTIHTGMLGYYGNMFASNDVVGMVTGDCLPLMAPTGGAEALLGTNPICFAFPTADDPVLIDMATSAISYGRVKQLDEAGQKLPPNCAIDPDGQPTQEPDEAKKGALLPFGAHRGGVLGVAVQLLAGVLTGADPVPEGGEGYGLLLVGFQKGVFAGEKAYDRAIREFINRYNSVQPRGEYDVRLPGSRRFKKERMHREKGQIQISPELADLLGV